MLDWYEESESSEEVVHEEVPSPPPFIESVEAFPLQPVPENPLYSAIKSRNLEEVRKLSKLPNLTQDRDLDGRTPLRYACELRNFDIVATLIDAEPSLIDLPDFNRFSPIHVAAQAGRLDLVHLLIINQAKVNVRTSCNETPLHLAAAKANIQVIKCLVEGGANARLKNNYESTPLAKLCCVYFESRFESAEEKLACIQYLLPHTFDQPYSILDLFELITLNLFSEKRKIEPDIFDPTTEFFLSNFYGPQTNRKYALIQRLPHSIRSLAVFLHSDIDNVERFMFPQLRYLIVYTKKLSEIVYSFFFVGVNFEDEELQLAMEIAREIYAIGLNRLLEPRLFANLLQEQYSCRPKHRFARFASTLLSMDPTLDFGAIYVNLVKRATLTESSLEMVNPLICPLLSDHVETLLLNAFTSKSVSSPTQPLTLFLRACGSFRLCQQLLAPRTRLQEPFPLKRLARETIRGQLGRKHETCAEFVAAIEALEIPKSLRYYLRFVERDYRYWSQFYDDVTVIRSE